MCCRMPVAAVSEQAGQEEAVSAGRGWGRVCRILWASGRTWALTQREVGTAEGCGQRRDTLGCVCSRAPSGGHGGENRLRNRAGARGRREVGVRGRGGKKWWNSRYV